MRLLFAILILLSASPLKADPTLAPIFGDHMVLQRDQRVAVWGNGSPGERITVSLSAASPSTTADPRGAWKLYLPPMQAGGPFTLTVKGNKIVAIKDVMIGEVWLLSGQSNMTFPLERASNAASAIAAANRPDIRLFTVAKNDSLTPQSQLTGQWQECTPDSARGFSAVAYFFGLELSHHLGVPIGLIHSSWPGSAGEEWVDERSLEQHSEFAPILKRWQDAPKTCRLRPEKACPLILSSLISCSLAQTAAERY